MMGEKRKKGSEGNVRDHGGTITTNTTTIISDTTTTNNNTPPSLPSRTRKVCALHPLTNRLERGVGDTLNVSVDVHIIEKLWSVANCSCKADITLVALGLLGLLGLIYCF